MSAERPVFPSKEGRVSTEKQALWDRRLQELDKTVDRLGMGLDPGIKQAVAGLNLLGFRTSGSCEGHVYDGDNLGHGLPFPWVDFQAPGRPDERFVGQNAAYIRAAQKYGVPVEDVRRSIHEEAWREAEKSMSHEQTPEYIRWDVENNKMLAQVRALLSEYEKGRDAPEEIRVRLSRGRLHAGGAYYGTDTQEEQDWADRLRKQVEAGEASKEDIARYQELHARRRAERDEEENRVEGFRKRLKEGAASEEEIGRYRELLAQRQAEMGAFTLFLKEKFFRSV